MKSQFFVNIAIAFVLTLISFAGVLAQSQPQTVTEFYLALPGSVNGIAGTEDLDGSEFKDDFFFYSNERNESRSAIIKYRKSLIKTEDIKNGYLRLESGEWEGWAEIVLFKKTGGKYLVAVSQVGCGPSCDGGVMFLYYKNGKWTNVTKQVFPFESSYGPGYYRLPRVGTTIELICGDESGETCRDGEKLAEFKWNKKKFVK